MLSTHITPHSKVLLGHARVAKLVRQLLVEIDFGACNKASHTLDEGGIDWPQRLGMLVDFLHEGVGTVRSGVIAVLQRSVARP